MNKIGLDVIKEEVCQCVKCPELVVDRLQTVFGSGNPYAEIFIVGEAPGKNESISGLPFVGRAGELLTNILKACNIERESVFIANVLKCRPPNNRTPKPKEVSNCFSYLERQINVIKPKFILCLGSIASQALINLPIGAARGFWHDYKGYKVLCTYHPSYLLRTPEAKKLVWQDLQLLLKEIR